MLLLEKILQFLNYQMTTPVPYSWFHLLWLGITAVATIAACIFGPKMGRKQVKNTILYTAIVVAALEVYKQINFSFLCDGGIHFDYQWFAFPFQFCSTPMYAGLLLGLTREGKLHNALAAYLATFAVFAGVAVMLYPTSVFVGTVGINIQTMICHGSMLPIGALLYASGYVKAEHRTIFSAGCVFISAVLVALVMNEIAHLTGLLESETFNMFFISPYCTPSLPVYSLVQQVLPFPLCLVIYISGFTAAAYILLLIAMLFISRKAK